MFIRFANQNLTIFCVKRPWNGFRFSWKFWCCIRSIRKSRKRNLVYSIHMYWTIFWLPTVQQIFSKNTLKEVRSLHLYASFGNFCVQICQSFQTFRAIRNRSLFSFKNSQKKRSYRFQTLFKDSVDCVSKNCSIFR